MTPRPRRIRALLTHRRPVTRRDLRQFLAAVRGSDRLTVLRVAWDAVVVWIVLRLRGLDPLLEKHAAGPPVDPEVARRVAAAVDNALVVLPFAPTCLRRSVTLIRELDRQHMGATLHIGVRNSTGRVEAHAWVQSGDEIVNDTVEHVATFLPLAVGTAGRLRGNLLS